MAAFPNVVYVAVYQSKRNKRVNKRITSSSQITYRRDIKKYSCDFVSGYKSFALNSSRGLCISEKSVRACDSKAFLICVLHFAAPLNLTSLAYDSSETNHKKLWSIKVLLQNLWQQTITIFMIWRYYLSSLLWLKGDQSKLKRIYN